MSSKHLEIIFFFIPQIICVDLKFQRNKIADKLIAVVILSYFDYYVKLVLLIFIIILCWPTSGDGRFANIGILFIMQTLKG